MTGEEKVKTEKSITLCQAIMQRLQKLRLTNQAYALIALLVLAGDQLSKFWVGQIFYPGETRPLIHGIFHLTYVRNPGAAFGLFAHKTPFFIVISLLIVFLLIFSSRFIQERHFVMRLALALLLGGALGNLSDRLRTGYVVDFFDFRVWPVFNLADVALVIGVILLAIGLLNLDFFLLKPRK